MRKCHIVLTFLQMIFKCRTKWNMTLKVEFLVIIFSARKWRERRILNHLPQTPCHIVLYCLLPRTIQFIGLTYVQEIYHEYIYKIIAVRPLRGCREWPSLRFAYTSFWASYAPGRITNDEIGPVADQFYEIWYFCTIFVIWIIRGKSKLCIYATHSFLTINLLEQ